MPVKIKYFQMHEYPPELIIHYFKTKENVIIELVDLLIKKYEAPELLQLGDIKDLNKRFQKLINTLFSFEWSRTIDSGIHFFLQKR